MTDDRMEARVTPIDIAFQKVRPALTHVAVLSIIANLSSLSFIVYSMVAMTYVLQTNNLATMYSLFALFVMFNLLSAIITAMMTYILKKTANIFSREMIAIISESSLEMRLNRSRSIGVEVIQDAETVRDFYVGINVVTLLRLPWALAYILFCFYENVWVGVFSIIVVSVTPVLAILGAGENQEIKRAIFAAHMAKTHFVRSLAEKYEFLPAMGILKNLSLRWKRKSAEVVVSDLEAKHIEKFNNLFIKFWRYFATYTVGAIIAYLAIRGDVSMNIMLPASIAMGALAGIGQIAIYQWPNYLRARAAYDRLQGLFRAMEGKQRLLSLPRPDGRLEVKSLAVAAPGGTRFLLSQVSFGVPAGSAMGVIGPSGAGKSTLVRALVGIWPPSHGSVRLDGSELHHWDADELGSHLGYLPQNVELLSGTIAENIARFGEVDDEAVLEAARLAGVHDVIQGLAQGYNTQVGEGGSALSGGQRQRVGLARALYGRPALVVLDEPNSNLDALGESALAHALKAMKERGTTCILVTHKANILKMVDLVLVLKDGTLSAFGPRDTILAPAGVPSIAPATVPPPRQLAARRTGDAA